MPIPLAPMAVPSIVKGISGLLSIGKANRAARANKFPIEQVNPLLQENAAMAEQMARTGMPQEQYNRAQQGIQRNQAGVLGAFSRNPSRTNLSSVLRASNDAQLNLDANDAQEVQANKRFSLGQRGILAGEQNRVWDWNNRQKYIQKANAIAQQLGAGKKNAFGALNDLTQLGGMSLFNQDEGYVSENPVKRMLGIGRRTPLPDIPYTQSVGVKIS